MRAILMLLVLVLLLGCSDPAKEKFETARFEEQQFNRPHAIKLYQEVATKYPNSPYAKQAVDRIEELRRAEQ